MENKKNVKTKPSFEFYSGQTAGHLEEAWRSIFHLSRNLYLFADDPNFEEIVNLVKKFEVEIYSVSTKFDEEVLKLLNL